MPPEEPLSKSPLDKPLQQLTEDDISQLTREDCRRYLKEKGMRRPSWNKSQAIQQVISLKTLLEPPTSDSDSAAGTCKKRYIPRPRFDNLNNNNNNKNDNPSLNSATRGTSADAEVSESAEEAVPYEGGKDVEKPDVSGRLLVGDSDSTPPRNTDSSNTPVGQMTIFYCGRVNVYDDVPADKAQALLHLAASPLHLPQEPLIDSSLALLSTRHLQATSVKASPDSAVILLPNTQTVKMNESTRLHGEEYKFPEDNPDVPASRKASVQRYLEKRKDRFKSKRKVGTMPTTSLDVYLNHQMGHQFPNEHPSRTDPCSPPQIRPSNAPIRCSSMENNLTGNANFSAGIKDKDVKK
ncbi:protein TIFY 4B-like isoform X1 [Coffea arabica]|uniref:Protein TIFY n=1 Tax=Coffea arabica TaxID=13443 RepID=A0A6P6WI21_COFAR|nr:protein TIFY 4B-like isoform X1 [Coffea arabica]